MKTAPNLKLDDYRDAWNKRNDYLYFEWEGNSLVVDKPHMHDFYMILLLHTSNGMHSIDFREHVTESYQLHFLFPGQMHFWRLAADTIAHQLMISKDCFHTISSALIYDPQVYHKHPVLPLEEEEYHNLLREFKSIKAELQEPNIIWEIIIARSRLIALIASRKLNKMLSPGLATVRVPKLFEYINLIDLHFREEKKLPFYASHLHLTVNYLNELCNKYLRKSATTIIRERIVLEAKRELSQPDKSIKEIAHDLGFADLANFSKFFKSQTGYRPKAFKETMYPVECVT